MAEINRWWCAQPRGIDEILLLLFLHWGGLEVMVVMGVELDLGLGLEVDVRD